MLIHAVRPLLIGRFNYLLWCDAGDFQTVCGQKTRLQYSPPTAPLHKNPPLDLKSKQPKWLDEIRATLLAVKLNRICACWFEDLHTILSTPGGGANIQLRMICDSKQRLWLSFVCCGRLTGGSGGSGSTKASTTSTRGAQCRSSRRLRDFFADPEDQRRGCPVLSFVCLLTWINGGTLIWDSQSKKLTRFFWIPFLPVTVIAPMQGFTLFLPWNDWTKTGSQTTHSLTSPQSAQFQCFPLNLPTDSFLHLCPRCLLFCSRLMGSPTVFFWKSFDVMVASVLAFLDLLFYLLLVELLFHLPSHRDIHVHMRWTVKHPFIRTL